MPEGLQTVDGKPVDLEQAEKQFHASMAAPSSDEPMAPAPPKVDHEAPYGRKADGTPRKRAPGPGRPPTARTTKQAPKDTGKSSESAQDVAERRTAGVESLFNVGAAMALGLSVRLGDAYKADAVVLSMSAKPIASACTEVAEQDPRFAALLDKITASGPYAALAATAVPIVAQLAMNHGVTAMRALNAVPPEELLAQLDEVHPDEGLPTAA
jgi:hypothetical protein